MEILLILHLMFVDVSGQKFEMRTNVKIEDMRQCQQIANWLNNDYRTAMTPSQTGYISVMATCDKFYNS